MKFKLTTPFLAAIGAIVLVATLFLSSYFSTSAFRDKENSIILPSEQNSGIITPSTESSNENIALTNIDITKDNVLDVISTIKRPSSYQYTVNSTLYFDNQATSTIYIRYTLGDTTRVDEVNAAGVIYSTKITNEEDFYAWNSDDTTFFSGKKGDFDSDTTVSLPTYEDLLYLDYDDIIEVSILNLNYEPCIYVKTSQNSVIIDYYISSISGLLVRADYMQNDEIIRACVVSSVDLTPPDSSLFILPNGTSALI